MLLAKGRRDGNKDGGKIIKEIINRIDNVELKDYLYERFAELICSKYAQNFQPELAMALNDVAVAAMKQLAIQDQCAGVIVAMDSWLQSGQVTMSETTRRALQSISHQENIR